MAGNIRESRILSKVFSDSSRAVPLLADGDRLLVNRHEPLVIGVFGIARFERLPRARPSDLAARGMPRDEPPGKRRERPVGLSRGL
jgi:hypothetical protein